VIFCLVAFDADCLGFIKTGFQKTSVPVKAQIPSHFSHYHPKIVLAEM